jgi:hypothetical protein
MTYITMTLIASGVINLLLLWRLWRAFKHEINEYKNSTAFKAMYYISDKSILKYLDALPAEDAGRIKRDFNEVRSQVAEDFMNKYPDVVRDCITSNPAFLSAMGLKE